MSEYEVNKYERFVNYLLNYHCFSIHLSKFSLYRDSVKYGISIDKIESSINFLEEIMLELVGFDIENENKTVSQLLNDEGLKHVKEKLLDFLENHLETEYELQNHSSCLKIINLYYRLVDLQQLINDNEILSFEEWKCISNYLISIVNNNKIEEINCVCDLIDNSPNGIDRTFVNSLLQLAHEYEKRQPMKLGSIGMEPGSMYIDLTYKEPDLIYKELDLIYKEPDLIYKEPDLIYKESDLMAPEPGLMYPKPGSRLLTGLNLEQVPPQENPHEHQEEK